MAVKISDVISDKVGPTTLERGVVTVNKVAIENSTQTQKSNEWVTQAISLCDSLRASWKSDALLKAVSRAKADWAKLLFPKSSKEAWKYTDSNNVLKGSYELSSIEASLDSSSTEMLEQLTVSNNRIVFVDGVFSSTLSALPEVKGVTVLTPDALCSGSHEEVAALFNSSGTVTNEHHVVHEHLGTLATSLLMQPVAIDISASTTLREPIQIIHLFTEIVGSSGMVCAPHIVVRAAEHSKFSLLESYDTSTTKGEFPVLLLPRVEVFVGAGADVTLTSFTNINSSSRCFGVLSAGLENNSHYKSNFFNFSPGTARNDLGITLSGSGADATINGLSVLTENAHVDTNVTMHHAAPHCESNQLIKGIYSGKSRGIFSGTIVVDQCAQKTNAFQSSQSLLLDPSASVDTRPQLKIFADDVKCTHGATVGQLDADAIFYLRSRGISAEEARGFLLKAFAGEVLAKLGDKLVREFIERRVDQLLRY